MESPKKDQVLWYYSSVDMQITSVKFVERNKDGWYRVMALELSAAFEKGKYFADTPGSFFSNPVDCLEFIIRKLIQRNKETLNHGKQ